MAAKKIVSPRFNLTEANIPSVLKSAGIVVFALVGFALIDYLYPNFDVKSYTDVILLGAATWLVNLVKEWIEEK